MGAYAALVSLAQTIDEILNNDRYYPISLHITSIREHLISFKAFFEEFPDKSNDILEARIRDIALEAEHRIIHFMLNPIVEGDKWNIKSIARGVIKNSIIIQKVRLGAAASASSRLAPFDDNWHELSDTINSIAREVMLIKNSVTIKDLRLGDDDDSLPPAAASSSSSLAPSHDKDAMVGFDAHLLAIKERLCGQSPKLQVIPIVGMGGIGKTTLALNAYNDPLISEHFLIRAWATVSQDYSAQKILSNLLLFMKEFLTEKLDKVNNEEKVYKILKGRKYLIVMDDIWSSKAWDDVRRTFPDDHNGSRILLTTRITDVAAYADSSSHLHQMHLMDTDQSWDLLRGKVFKQKVCPLELEDIGKEIAGSCRGLPLSIVVVAGVLSTVSKTPASWEDIAKNLKSANIAMNDEQFQKIFSLSYTHLPHHLRPCFLYMGAFPEDYDINVSMLIKLWVAEGFIKPSESKNLEEMAEEYLEDLVKRFLVLVSKKKCNGKIKSCRLHDVIRELCIRKAEQEKLLLCVRDTSNLHEESTRNQRRLSIIKQSHDRCLAKFYGSTIRTLIVSGGNPILYSKYFRFLRVSHFENPFFFYAQMFELFHLRYLLFEWITISSSIPAAITDLQNLQTLIITRKGSNLLSNEKVSLPSGIWRMPQLRHLVCYRFDALPNPEEGAICGLENLQTLLEVRNFKCSESIMRMIPGVKKLGIYYGANDSVGDEECQLENLVHLQHLEKLKITVDGNDPFCFLEKNVNLAFPRTLKKLSLVGWGLRWDKDMMKIVGSLPNLQVLKLIQTDCRWKKWETSEGEFPELKYLLIEDTFLEEWISESSHFPSLIRLKLDGCYGPLKIPDGIGDIPTLELIHLGFCGKSVVQSVKRIQEEQQSYGNDALQVRQKNTRRTTKLWKRQKNTRRTTKLWK